VVAGGAKEALRRVAKNRSQPPRAEEQPLRTARELCGDLKIRRVEAHEGPVASDVASGQKQDGWANRFKKLKIKGVSFFSEATYATNSSYGEGVRFEARGDTSINSNDASVGSKKETLRVIDWRVRPHRQSTPLPPQPQTCRSEGTSAC
jgi:hypothetical protein